MLAGRESGKKSAAAEEARDFFLPLCFVAHKERGFRVPPKRTSETGVSRGYQCGPQRRVRAMAISANPTATGVQREKTERFLHGGSVPSSAHQPEKLVCSPAGAGRGWELKLGLRC